MLDRRTLLAAVGVAPFLSAASSASGDADWGEADRIVSTIPEARIPARTFRITPASDGDGRKAIQDAIDTASAAGGGRVVLRRGDWFSKGPLRLKTGVDLHLERGVLLRFSPDPADYLPTVLSRWEGAQLFNYAPLIGAENVTDIAITGQGTIDGGADAGFWKWEELAAPGASRLRRLAFENAALADRQFGPGGFLRPSAIAFVGAQRVRLEQFTLRNTAFWMIQMVYVDGAVLRRLTVDSHQMHNDAIDLDSSRNVLVEHCTMRTGNYSIAMKSGRDLEGRTLARPTERIVIRNNRFAGSDGVGFGSEMSGGIRDIYISDNRMADVGVAFNFKSNLDRGGFIENVNIRRMRIGTSDTVIKMGLGGIGEFGGNFPPRVSRIRFSDVWALESQRALDINGPDALPIEDLILRDVRIATSANPIVCKNASHPVLDRVVIGNKTTSA